MSNRYEMDMCSGPLFGKMLRFALPLVASGILQLLFNAADIVVVGRFAENGNDALAAVSSTGALINLIVNLLTGISVGASVVVSRSFGAGNKDAVSRAVHTAISVAAVGGVIFGIFGFLTCGHFLAMMDSPPSVLPLSTLYVRIYFCGLPVMMLYNFGAAVLRAVGDTRRPLIYLTLAGILNVVLNMIFVICFDMGVAGVGLATTLSQCLSCVLVLRCLMVNGGTVKLSLKKLRIYGAELLQIIRVGLPAGVQGSLFSVSNVLIQSSINGFGNVVMAGNGAAANIEGFVYIAMNSFHHTALNFTGQNAGAGKLDRVRRVALISAVTVTVVGGGLGILCYLAAEPLLSIYRPGEMEVIAAGIERMKYVCVPYFLCGLMEILVGVMRGLGHSVVPMIVSLLGACGFRILWIYTIFAANPTADVLYFSYPVSWLVTVLGHTVCFIFAYRSLKRRQAAALSSLPA